MKTRAMIDAEKAKEAMEAAVKAIRTVLGEDDFVGMISSGHSRVTTFHVGDEVLTVRWVWPG